MVALDERFQHKGTKAPRRCRRKDGFGRYSKSPTASVTSVNSVACNYYLLQDLLYRAVALTNSSGQIAEAYDCEAYGNTLIFTAPDTSGNWWGDAAVQSDYGANEIIYCGYRFDPETQNYYVRNRTYNSALGRWVQRDPIGYSGGINLYIYVVGRPVIWLDSSGLQGSIAVPPLPVNVTAEELLAWLATFAPELALVLGLVAIACLAWRLTQCLPGYFECVSDAEQRAKNCDFDYQMNSRRLGMSDKKKCYKLHLDKFEDRCTRRLAKCMLSFWSGFLPPPWGFDDCDECPKTNLCKTDPEESSQEGR